MRSLVIDAAHFRLPDNFNGGLSDALRLLADYHDDKHKLAEITVVKNDPGNILDMTHRQARALLFDQFLDGITKGRRFTGLIQLVQYDPKVDLETIK
jgi:hypothetical protein